MASLWKTSQKIREFAEEHGGLVEVLYPDMVDARKRDPHWKCVGTFPFEQERAFLHACKPYLRRKRPVGLYVNPGGQVEVYALVTWETPMRMALREARLVAQETPSEDEPDRPAPWRLAVLFMLFLMSAGTWFLEQHNKAVDRTNRFNAALRGQQRRSTARSSKMSSHDALWSTDNLREGTAMREGVLAATDDLDRTVWEDARLELVTVTVSGGDKDHRRALDTAALTAMPKVEECFRQVLAGDIRTVDPLEGELTVQIEIGEDGRLTDATVQDQSIPVFGLDDCVADAFAELEVRWIGGGKEDVGVLLLRPVVLPASELHQRTVNAEAIDHPVHTVWKGPIVFGGLCEAQDVRREWLRPLRIDP